VTSRQSREPSYSDMRARISSVLGDPKKVFGPDWTDKIAQRFDAPDFACARALIRRDPPPRYVGVLRKAGESLAAERGQRVMAASTMESLLAHFLQVAMRSRCGPDEVRLDQATGNIVLLLRGVPLVDLQAFSPMPVSDYALDRVEACLFRHEGFGSEEDLHERLRASLRLDHIARGSDCEHARIPSAAGWLLAAGQLAGQHGVHDGTPALDEQLAAAILGAPSWPVLAANRSAVAEACGPWYLSRGQEGCGPLEIYSSPLHAAAALFEGLSTGQIFPRSSFDLLMQKTPAGYPMMTFYNPWPDGELSDVQDAYDEVSVRPCHTVNPTEKWTAHARRALQMRDARSIELAFGADWKRDERLRAYDSYHDQRLLAQSGNWRFTVNRAGPPKVLQAHRIDGTGRSVFHAVVRTRDGYLLRFRNLKEHVLTAYCMREPVAVIDGIDKSTAEAVSEVLQGEGELRHAWRMLDADCGSFSSWCRFGRPRVPSARRYSASQRAVKSLIASMDDLVAA